MTMLLLQETRSCNCYHRDLSKDCRTIKINTTATTTILKSFGEVRRMMKTRIIRNETSYYLSSNHFNIMNTIKVLIVMNLLSSTINSILWLVSHSGKQIFYILFHLIEQRNQRNSIIFICMFGSLAEAANRCRSVVTIFLPVLVFYSEILPPFYKEASFIRVSQ